MCIAWSDIFIACQCCRVPKSYQCTHCFCSCCENTTLYLFYNLVAYQSILKLIQNNKLWNFEICKEFYFERVSQFASLSALPRRKCPRYDAFAYYRLRTGNLHPLYHRVAKLANIMSLFSFRRHVFFILPWHNDTHCFPVNRVSLLGKADCNPHCSRKWLPRSFYDTVTWIYNIVVH